MFICYWKFNDVIWATVADRRLLKTANVVLVQFCSELNTARVSEIISGIIGTGLPMVMVESPTYYQAFQPVLKAIQSIEPDVLSFVEELVTLKQNPCKLFNTAENIDASLVYKDSTPKKLISLKEFIDMDHREDISVFDKSQEEAIKQALVNSIGIIQGPPGTGKSFIGVQMLRILLSMPSLENTKVLIITYKNHALDEFTKDVLKYFPTKIVRIGGRSLDHTLDKISLNTLKLEGNKCYDFMGAKNSLHKEINVLKEELENAFDAMDENSRFSYSDIISRMPPIQQLYLIKNCDWNKCNLKSFGILKDESDGYTTHNNKKTRNKNTITHAEVAYILKNISECTYVNEFKKLLEYSFKLWVPDDQSFLNAETRLTGKNNRLARTNINEQNSPSNKEVINDAKEDNNFLYRNELKELEDERIAAISGSRVKRSEPEVKRNIHERETPKKSSGSIAAFSKIASKTLLNEGYYSLITRENLWDLEPEERALFMQYYGAIQSDASCSEFETKVRQFEEKIDQLAEINNTITEKQLKDRQIFAMTITGASIHNNLLSIIRPEIIIIEEAAEILEPQLVAAMGSWTKYMLLIGDHYQLRPTVETYELKTKFNFDVSMIERLINNHMNYSTLEIQNRQRPEMANLLLDIYPGLKTNMQRVANNHQAKCLTQSSFFWNHDFPEKNERSVTNPDEGERVVMLALFLLQQGYNQNHITILATYNGQVSLLRKLLKAKFYQHHKNLVVANKSIDTDEFIKVNTVDMFQGDENDFVIISLVRSNAEKNIGFLKERNRRCVAQSRGRCGVYFVVNSSMFSKNAKWSPMMKQLQKYGRIGDHLEIKCQYHPLQLVKVTKITLDCFCKEPCTLIMDCKKHTCSKTCQPLHGHAECSVEVPFVHFNCGHNDIRKCFVDQSHKNVV